MLKVAVEDSVTHFKGRVVLPIHVGFWKANSTGIVGGGASGGEVEFPKVIGCIETVRVLEDETHGVGGFKLRELIAPEGRVEGDGGRGTLGGMVGGVVGQVGSIGHCSRG